mmetsp:Transcript_5187/g.7668  ORF Transcript_5187/g.7668 Transcript_5187/m.7668 type:complete len:228 (+) Transcript_5187:414-1097(+)
MIVSKCFHCHALLCCEDIPDAFHACFSLRSSTMPLICFNNCGFSGFDLEGCSKCEVLSAYSIELCKSSENESNRSSEEPKVSMRTFSLSCSLGACKLYARIRRLRPFSSLLNIASAFTRSLSKVSKIRSCCDGWVGIVGVLWLPRSFSFAFSSSRSNAALTSGSFGSNDSITSPLSSTVVFQNESEKSSVRIPLSAPESVFVAHAFTPSLPSICSTFFSCCRTASSR